MMIKENYELFQLAETIFTLGRSYIVNHSSGLADFDQSLLSGDYTIARKRFYLLIRKVDDIELQSHFSVFFGQLAMLNKIDNEIITIYCNKLNCSKKDLKKKVREYLLQKNMPPPDEIVNLARDTISIIQKFEQEYIYIKEYIKN